MEEAQPPRAKQQSEARSGARSSPLEENAALKERLLLSEVRRRSGVGNEFFRSWGPRPPAISVREIRRAAVSTTVANWNYGIRAAADGVGVGVDVDTAGTAVDDDAVADCCN